MVLTWWLLQCMQHSEGRNGGPEQNGMFLWRGLAG